MDLLYRFEGQNLQILNPLPPEQLGEREKEQAPEHLRRPQVLAPRREAESEAREERRKERERERQQQLQVQRRLEIQIQQQKQQLQQQEQMLRSRQTADA